MLWIKGPEASIDMQYGGRRRAIPCWGSSKSTTAAAASDWLEHVDCVCVNSDTAIVVAALFKEL